MAIQNFAYIVESQKGVREALADVWQSALRADWVVLGDYDLSGILMGGSQSQASDVKSIDICSPEYARKFIQAERLTALCMPCNVLVFRENEKTFIATMQPAVMLPELFTQAVGRLRAEAEKVDQELRAIIDAAK